MITTADTLEMHTRTEEVIICIISMQDGIVLLSLERQMVKIVVGDHLR